VDPFICTRITRNVKRGAFAHVPACVHSTLVLHEIVPLPLDSCFFTAKSTGEMKRETCVPIPATASCRERGRPCGTLPHRLLLQKERPVGSITTIARRRHSLTTPSSRSTASSKYDSGGLLLPTRPCLDAKFSPKFHYAKRRFSITSKCRHMHGVLNIDEIKN
jgi:hypothetical protein